MQHWSDIFPLLFLPFKVIVLAGGMFFAIKGHRDREIEEQEKRAELERKALIANSNGRVSDLGQPKETKRPDIPSDLPQDDLPQVLPFAPRDKGLSSPS